MQMLVPLQRLRRKKGESSISTTEQNQVNNKMEPYKDIEDLLTSIGACEPPDHSVWYLKLRYKLAAASITIGALCIALFDIFGGIHAESFTSFLHSFFDGLAFICMTWIIAVGYIRREQLKQLFLELQRNYDQCK